jgi:hypothetical protein
LATSWRLKTEVLEDFVKDFRRLADEFARTEATAMWISGLAPKHIASALKFIVNDRRAEPDPWWLSAVEALKTDSSAALPG